MASFLRQIIAGPRSQHAETGLDLCYVTSNIIATSGPSQTYPQRAYRNPLDRLVAFLDTKHGDNWAIWEFRAEGTGYPDEAVYNRIRHYPWPDHHPPPFHLVPMIMAGMRNWIAGGNLDGSDATPDAPKDAKSDRVVVVHCKAGKGRSGSMACSYLISQCGWTPEDAIARFTERRMRPKFGAGVSIPSQLRWISYVDRWTRGGKKYVDRKIEIVEVHVWGLRHGVKVGVEGFIEQGKKIKVLHTFRKDERIVVEGGAPGGAGVKDFVSDLAGYGNKATASEPKVDDTPEYHEVVDKAEPESSDTSKSTSDISRSASVKAKAHEMSHKLSVHHKSKTIAAPKPTTAETDTPELPSGTASKPSTTFADAAEPGGRAVIFRPNEPIEVPTSDVNITIERRNRTPGTMGLTMVTAVAHVWFNTFFEGQGPEQDGVADDSGVFEIDWDRMDGIKGSSRKGTRACDRISVLWRFSQPAGPSNEDPGVVVREPGPHSPVPQMRPADWKGGNKEDPAAEKGLGLRVADPESAEVSKASSIKSETGHGPETKESDSLKGVKSSGPSGEEVEHLVSDPKTS